MKWFTCTPVSYVGDAAFFARDSGLIARGFQALGIESKAIMPGEARPDDEPDLIRTGYANLTSPEWWRSHDLDGVVLYSWALPKFNRVAKAIHDAGITLVLNQDSGGAMFPVICLAGSIRQRKIQFFTDYGRITGSLVLLVWMVYRLTLGFVLLEFGRIKHLSYGDVIACVSPLAAERYRILLKRFRRDDLAGKVRLVPHPVAGYFRYDGRPKTNRVVAVGRWDDESQKRSRYLAETIRRALIADRTVEFDIVGQTTDFLSEWHESLSPENRSRVHLRGRVPNAELPGIYLPCTILLCSSSHESFHIPAAEALCCGCSVVAPRLASLPSFEWFRENASGTLSEKDTPEGLAAALLSEIGLWKSSRDAARISQTWTGLLHATNVCRTILSYQTRRTPV